MASPTDNLALADPQGPRRNPWGPVAAFASLFVFAVSASILPAGIVRAAAELGVQADTLAQAASSQFAGFFLASLLAGVLCDRFGKKPVLLTGCLATVVGAGLWAAAGSLSAAILAATILGAGGGTLECVGSALLADLYPRRRKLVLNLSQVAYCAGAVAGPAVMAVLLPRGVSWRTFFGIEAGLAAALGCAYLVATIPGPPRRLDGAGHGQSAGRVRWSMLLPAAALFCYVLAESGVVVFVNYYLQAFRDAPERWAVFSVSLVWLTMLVGRLLCAALPENASGERTILLLCLGGAATMAAQIFTGNWVLSFVLFGLTGLVLSGIWPLVVALSAARHPGSTGSAIGLAVAAGSLGVVAAPPLVKALLAVAPANLLYVLLAVPMASAGVLVLFRPKGKETSP